MQTFSRSKHTGTGPEALLHPASRSLFRYWNRMRGRRSAPSRQEIELRPIAAILPWIGVMERHSSLQRHRWRLAGTGIARLLGHGLTGSEVAADWPDVYRHSLWRALDGVYDRRQAFAARLKAVSARGEEVGVELFAAPVVASNGSSIHTLCTLVPFREPSWLGRVRVAEVELSTLIAIWTEPLPDEMEDLSTRSLQPVQLKLIRGGRAD